MNIVVLDGHTLNPGDLDWKGVEALGACKIYPRTAPDERQARLADADIAVSNKVRIDKALIAALPKLKYIAVTATGFDVIDIAAAKERGIPVSNVPEYGTRSVAQAVFSLILELANNAGAHAQSVRDGGWQKCPDFCYTVAPTVELAGRTLGIVGYGRIGGMAAEIGKALGMEIIVNTRTKRDMPYPWVDVDELFRRADVISLHCPLTPQNEKMVNAERLATMKPTAWIINTARGKLIDEPALADALNKGRIGGAGLDVISAEPPAAGNVLIGAKNCIITPHVAWATHAARSRLMGVTVENIKAFQAGKPANVVNK
jgi:glycerate dehydrogenase